MGSAGKGNLAPGGRGSSRDIERILAGVSRPAPASISVASVEYDLLLEGVLSTEGAFLRASALRLII